MIDKIKKLSFNSNMQFFSSPFDADCNNKSKKGQKRNAKNGTETGEYIRYP